MVEHQQDLNSKKEYTTNFSQERPAIQVALFILWRIYNKHYVIGSRLFRSEIISVLRLKDQNYKEALLFLEGAGAVVNEVIIIETLPKHLIERYGINHE
ncbi:hypothetical protein [Enterococcus sp. DIV0660C]|uniref:hypothetical protein n=1 Tax=Enterococcus sp. DIV0660C TaxID=2230880 RepID=UPI001A8C49CE|nr:hypothetical protein [Enterococcus sp. DIV0660C]MBO0431285.1 hypothetical protein [Enterococcus sp. DIV0660C]